ncbi:DUF4062 domain-containing protein [Acinetobacter sp. MD2]|uniref:DUF4062 domain-containing protein n=1 Tax=Acinetobacter sp. MD2 TaxID=2600066 RepID=UPI002D1E767D|nr:DUF4062 domain-containing protein [Acinetobacter sp. MD2]MEB3767024.1 DUF4062 domain-containing protein [Acinetobacter sp. MD2]
MNEKKYQVFLSTSGADMQAERQVLCQTLVGMGFFAWGLEQRTPLTTTLARRQIDECDYVALLLGQHYGELSMSGVSYMQLEYLHALNKQKPMVIFLQQPSAGQNTTEDAKIQEQYRLFRQSLVQDVPIVVEFSSLRELELAVRSQMSALVKRFSAQGWVRYQQVDLAPQMQGLYDKIKDLEDELAQKKIELEFKQPSIQLHDIYAMNYQVQAYQDGHFKELKLTCELSWKAILNILAPTFQNPSPEDYFALRLNAFLNETGLELAKKQMPRAHAVARSQVNFRDLHQIKSVMKSGGWLVQIGRDDRHRALWQLTEKGKAIIENSIAVEKQI